MTKQAIKGAVGELNVGKRTLFIRDNLEILRGMNSNSVDLIYLDPPFNSKKQYSAPIGSPAYGAKFKDAWSLEDVDMAWLGQIAEKSPPLATVISAAGLVSGKGNKAYLIFMGARLVEMHRILKDTGSIYLHCDQTMSHSLKMVMDAIFGDKNFRNEIVWGYKTGGVPNTRGAFARKHDTILFYAKGKNKFNMLCQKSYVPTLPEPHTPSGKRLGVERDKITKYRMVRMRDHWVNTGIMPGEDVKELYRNDRERTGYPTQKPLSLLRRIINASTDEGDVVLDPFCGCATAMVAAEGERRQWVGIDISSSAQDLVRLRLQDAQDMHVEKGVWKQVTVRKDVPVRTDAGDLTVNPKEYKHELYGEQDGKCNGCRNEFPFQNMTVDHVVPTSRGGQEIKSNLQLLCGMCNSIKGARTMEDLLARLKKKGTLTSF